MSNVVAVAAEEGVGLDAYGDVEIARCAARRSGVAFTGDTQARAGLCAGRYANLDRLGLRQAAVAMTSGADIAQPSLAIAARAGKAEFHSAGHLVDAARAIALWAHGGGATHRACAVAGLANFLTRGIEAHLSAADGLPEVDVEPVFQIRTFLRTAGGFLAAVAAEELAEDVAKSPSSAASLRAGPGTMVDVIGKIETAETHAGLTGRRTTLPGAWAAGRDVVGIEAVLIVNLALLRFAQDIVRFLHFLETLLSGFVARVQIGMVFARQLAVRFADLVFFGAARHAQRFVIIGFACGWHKRVVGYWLLVVGDWIPATTNQQPITNNQ